MLYNFGWWLSPKSNSAYFKICIVFKIVKAMLDLMKQIIHP